MDDKYIATATPYVGAFDGSKAVKTIYYRMPWVNTRDECDMFGALVSAMIVG
jgi:hypothetical protein